MNPDHWGDPEFWRNESSSSDLVAGAVHQMVPVVRRFLFRLGVGSTHLDDLTQEAMVRFLQHSREAEQPRAFLFAVARNVAREHFRAPASEAIPHLLDHSNEPHRQACQSEVLQHLREELQRLPLSLREVLVLSLYEELQPTQIGQVLGLSPEAVRHRLFRARQLLKRAMSQSAVREVNDGL